MKKKKLKLMNINEDTSLSRFDMKNILAGSGCQECVCSTQECEDVYFVQCEAAWNLYVECGGSTDVWAGPGQYGGTVCHGACP